MTAVNCDRPAWRLSDVRPARSLNLVESAVEDILALRHEYEEHNLAVRLLRGIRPDLQPWTVEAWIDTLLDDAEMVRAAETQSRQFRDQMINEYERHLSMFAHGGKS